MSKIRERAVGCKPRIRYRSGSFWRVFAYDRGAVPLTVLVGPYPTLDAAAGCARIGVGI